MPPKTHQIWNTQFISHIIDSMADGGTVFLDEIGELSPLIQVELLRVLQQREIERVGESKKRKINIRVIAAPHQDLYNRVREGHFREDLYYRLKVFPIQLPPLWKRKEDMPLLEAGDWNKAEVARQIGLSRTAVWKYPPIPTFLSVWRKRMMPGCIKFQKSWLSFRR